MPTSFNTPPAEELLEQDVTSTPPDVNVRVQNVVRVEEMGTENSYKTVLLRTGQPAIKILNRNPARKRVVMWMYSLGTGGEAVIISNRKGDADGFTGAAMYSFNAITRYEFTEKGELYAIGCDPTFTAGDFSKFATSTDDVLLSIVEEFWSS